MSELTGGKIFTFYSYKGGTGRTMALANIAWILASRGKRVLVIDWDLEAPGLHRYFAPFLSDPKLSETDGLMEFLARYVVDVTKELPEDTALDDKWYRPYADIKRYAEPIEWQFPDSGGIDIVGAGRQNASYGARVNRFDWDGFYKRFGGGAFLDETVEQMKAAYHYVLIDSRTGISDTSGICTIHLPDALVVFYTLNNQSIEGASGITDHVVVNRRGRSKEPFRVWSMATRVELAEKEKLEARRLFARERFAPFLETLAGLGNQQNEDYWGEMEVLYDPFYAYDEILATVADLPGRTNSVLAAFERLCARITNGDVSRLGDVSETKRREALELYSRIGMTKPVLKPTDRRQSKTWDIFLSASGNDSQQAERLYYLLRTSCKVFHASKEIAPGEPWEERVMEALEHSRAMVLLFSEESAQRNSKWMSMEIQVARRRLEQDPTFKLIPVQLDPGADPPADFLKRYHWLSRRDGDMQDVAFQIRHSLGTSKDHEDDSEHNILITAELDRAVKEKAALRKLTQRLTIGLTGAVLFILLIIAFRAWDTVEDLQVIVRAKYVRENAGLDKSPEQINEAMKAEIQKALTFIGKTRKSYVVDLHKVRINDVNLPGAHLEQVVLWGSDLERANLENAHLYDTDLGGTNFDEANLKGADLSRSYIWESNIDEPKRPSTLRKANLSGANLDKAILTKANLQEAELGSAILTHAYLLGADLTGADMRGADMTGANLSGAILAGADLRGVKLDHANLSLADLSKANNLPIGQVKLANWDKDSSPQLPQVIRKELESDCSEYLSPKSSPTWCQLGAKTR
ncbi:MAG: TIR domain-containing protein [Nitrospira sp. LK70]|nr:TIR domain-containing protein [Nitrospira sp. LK70]